MYLSKLNSKQKDLFLDVCLAMSKRDDDFCKKEEDLIRDLCSEMEISYRDQANCSLVDSINALAVSLNKEQKKMVLLETTGVAMVDRVVAEKEKSVLVDMIKAFNLSLSDYDEVLKLVDGLYACYSSLAEYIKK